MTSPTNPDNTDMPLLPAGRLPALDGDDWPVFEAGWVWMVGGGPGDPGLITLHALNALQQADVIIYDALVDSALLRWARPDAVQEYAGKRGGKPSPSQRDISLHLIELARQNKRVLRLKGGDPFIFGRGGEEIEELAAHGVPFQVVPGITAANGCSAYAGIPLTHRDYAQSVRFVTGHLKDGTTNLPWSELVATGQTLVFYMGLVGLPDICSQLIAHGRSAQTPIALVQQGTTSNQKVLIGTLADMPERVAGETIKPPTLLIVGEVVSLHDKLKWFRADALPPVQGVLGTEQG